MTSGERSFLVKWSLGTAIVIAAVLMVTPTLTPILAGGLAGLAIGLGQWLTLRTELPGATAWVGITTIACMVATESIDVLASFSVSPLVYIAGAYLLLGGLIGMGQWLLLRRYLLRASAWIGISIVSYLAGIAVLTMIGSAPAKLEIVSQLPLAVVPGLVIGIMSGIGMLWLLRHPVPGRQAPQHRSASQ